MKTKTEQIHYATTEDCAAAWLAWIDEQAKRDDLPDKLFIRYLRKVVNNALNHPETDMEFSLRVWEEGRA